jgi:hypothetical protein
MGGKLHGRGVGFTNLVRGAQKSFPILRARVVKLPLLLVRSVIVQPILSVSSVLLRFQPLQQQGFGVGLGVW